MRMHITFLDKSGSLAKLWEKELAQLSSLGFGLKWYNSQVRISIQTGSLDEISINKEVRGSTAIVSPGNSLGCLGGGIDKAIGQIFSPSADFMETERALRTSINNNGYSSPGSVKVVRLPHDFIKGSLAQRLLNANTIIHCPTMRSPKSLMDQGVPHAYKIVFDWTWEILNAVNQYNSAQNAEIKLEAIILPGLGTGYGKIPYEVCAKSMMAALFIFASPFETTHKSALAFRYLGDNYNSLGLEVPQGLPIDQFRAEKNSLIELFKGLGSDTSAQ